MPLYEYKCEYCDCIFEELVKFNDRRNPKCPECKGTSKRLVSAPAVIDFKGGTRNGPNPPGPPLPDNAA